MAIPVKCPTCRYSTHAADSQSGKIAKCPKCQNLIHIPDITWVGEIEKEATPPPFTPPIEEVAATPAVEAPRRRASVSTEQVKTWIKQAMIVVSAIMFLLTFHQSGAAGFSHYLSLIILSAFGIYRLLSKAPHSWRRWGTACSVVLLVLMWLKIDYYEHAWEETNSRNDRLTYRDYYPRLGRRAPYYREFWVWYDAGGHYHAEGGFSETMKLHGPWESYTSDNYETDRRWYWYGEEITEGEWHLRNK